MVLEKAEEPEIKLPISAGLSKKQASSRKISISALLTMPKPLTVWITINCGKFWKRWVRLFATPWTAAYQAPPSVGFSRQEYWSGLPLPSPAHSSTYLQNVYRIQPLLSLSKTPGPSPHHILPGSLEQPNDGCPCLCPCSLQFAMVDIPKDIIMNEQDKVPCLLKSHFFFKN